MPSDSALVITAVAAQARPRAGAEICEHKGVGHPDSICDGVVEAVSRALCAAYLKAYGDIQHYNVDKALLVGGQSAPRFGGGRVLMPMRLIISGRATRLPAGDLREFVRGAARDYLAANLRCDPNLFAIEPAVYSGSPNLRRVLAGGPSKRLANDTSVGAGYAPNSPLEQAVLKLGAIIRSAEFRSAFAAAGDDYKIMGVRTDDAMHFTIALAFLDREIRSLSEYFAIKAEVSRYLARAVEGAIGINLLDDSGASDESGIYLTVTGLSAEHGDDGQVGRGNRVNGLITPGRPMSLEAAAGKNPVAHVGKLYNVLAIEMARAIVAEVGGVVEASVQIVSTIGRPVAEPQLVAIEVVVADGLDPRVRQRIEEIAQSHLGRIDPLSERMIRGEVAVF